MWRTIASPRFFTLPLVADLAEKIVPPCDIRLPFYPFRRAAVDDTEHTPASLTLGNDNLEGLAVAQNIEHTSGVFRIAFITLMGYASAAPTQTCGRNRVPGRCLQQYPEAFGHFLLTASDRLRSFR